jgi:hypothetical protein
MMDGPANWRDSVENRLGALASGVHAQEKFATHLRHDIDVQAAKVDTLGVHLTTKIETTFGALRTDWKRDLQDALAAQQANDTRRGGAVDWKILFVIGVVLAGGLFGAGYMSAGGPAQELERRALEQTH